MPDRSAGVGLGAQPPEGDSGAAVDADMLLR
jgi:hypothetical protein